MTQTINTNTTEIKVRINTQMNTIYPGRKIGGISNCPSSINFMRFTTLVMDVLENASEEGDRLQAEILPNYLSSFELQKKAYFKLSESIVIRSKDFRLVLSPHGKDGVELYKIEVFDKGNGWGTRLLTLFNDITKQTGILVYLRPVEFSTTSIEQLRSWYSRNGFKRCCKNVYWCNK